MDEWRQKHLEERQASEQSLQREIQDLKDQLNRAEEQSRRNHQDFLNLQVTSMHSTDHLVSENHRLRSRLGRLQIDYELTLESIQQQGLQYSATIPGTMQSSYPFSFSSTASMQSTGQAQGSGNGTGIMSAPVVTFAATAPIYPPMRVSGLTTYSAYPTTVQGESSSHYPSGNDPSGNDPSGNDPSGSDPSGSDPSGSDLFDSDLFDSDLFGNNPPGNDSPGSYLSGTI